MAMVDVGPADYSQLAWSEGRWPIGAACIDQMNRVNSRSDFVTMTAL